MGRRSRWYLCLVISRPKCALAAITCWSIYAVYFSLACISDSEHAHKVCPLLYQSHNRPVSGQTMMSPHKTTVEKLFDHVGLSNYRTGELWNKYESVSTNNKTLVKTSISNKEHVEAENKTMVENRRHKVFQQNPLKVVGGQRLGNTGVAPESPEQQQEVQNKYYKLSNVTINPIDRKFNILSDHICRDNSLNMLILVPSIPANVQVRTAIRRTYGSLSADKLSIINGINVEYTTRIVFLLGRSPNKTVERLVRREHFEFKDIVEIDFIDSYYNLTMKILHGLKWAGTFCSKLQYVVKTDDDVFLNIAGLIKQLKTHKVDRFGAVFGTILIKEVVVEREGRWGVSKEQYPLTKYPPYAQGNSYTISGNLVLKIVQTAQMLPYVPIEDAFITGIVAGKMCGAKLIKIHGNSNWQEKKFVPNPCKFAKYKWVSTTNMTPMLMYKTFGVLQDYQSRCYFVNKP